MLAVADERPARSDTENDTAAWLSHEIRTSLGSFLGLTDLLLQTPMTSDQEHYVQMARSSADWLLGLANTMLDIAGAEAGGVEARRRSFDVEEVVGEILDLLAVGASQKGLGLWLRVDPRIPVALVGDEDRLRRVLLNLIGNATKFTEKGHVGVSVDMEDQGDTEAVLRFSVHDTGIGVPPDRQDAIFEPYTQADSSISRRFRGTGLGLAISRRLVETMGGHLWVESTPGAGAIFRFTVLMDVAAHPSRRRAAASSPF